MHSIFRSVSLGALILIATAAQAQWGPGSMDVSLSTLSGTGTYNGGATGGSTTASYNAFCYSSSGVWYDSFGVIHGNANAYSNATVFLHVRMTISWLGPLSSMPKTVAGSASIVEQIRSGSIHGVYNSYTVGHGSGQAVGQSSGLVPNIGAMYNWTSLGNMPPLFTTSTNPNLPLQFDFVSGTTFQTDFLAAVSVNTSDAVTCDLTGMSATSNASMYINGTITLDQVGGMPFP